MKPLLALAVSVALLACRAPSPETTHTRLTEPSGLVYVRILAKGME